MEEETRVAIAQIDAVLVDYKNAQGRSRYDDLSDLGGELPELVARAAATVERLAPPGSSYKTGMDRAFEKWGINSHMILPAAIGILGAMKADYSAGYLASVPALIHGEIFGDFLDMALHLRESHYKDAAAVVAGSTLEAHLRQLAEKSDVAVYDSDDKPLKAERLNAELAKVGAFDKNDQKSVTAWLGIRNEAAHGNYEAYEEGQVAIMIDGIRDFVRRKPA